MNFLWMYEFKYACVCVCVCVCVYVYIYVYMYVCIALQKYWNSKVKIVLLAVESRHLQIWLKDEYETKLQNVTFY